MADREYHLREWPRRIRVEQDVPGADRAQIVDADTGTIIDGVLSLAVSRKDTFIEVTAAAHEPFKPAANATEDEAAQYDVEQGVLVERRKYLITSMRIEAEA